METTLDSPTASAQGPVTYAGFWLRFVALIIDGLIVGIIYSLIVSPIFAFLGFGIASTAENFEAGAYSEEEALGMLGMAAGAFFTVLLLTQVLYLLYFAIMESSKFQGTFGKVALGLKVTDANGEKLSFGAALLRNLGKIISQIILYVGFIMAGFTEKKQALHDMMVGALVIKK